MKNRRNKAEYTSDNDEELDDVHLLPAPEEALEEDEEGGTSEEVVNFDNVLNKIINE